MPMNSKYNCSAPLPKFTGTKTTGQLDVEFPRVLNNKKREGITINNLQPHTKGGNPERKKVRERSGGLFPSGIGLAL